MSIESIDIIVQNPALTVEVVSETARPVIEVVVHQGLTGPPGDSTAVEELPLTVEVNGQTEFNVFVFPSPGQVNELNINGVDYYEGNDYNFQTIGLNKKLVWHNQFELSTTDVLKFRKY